MSYVKTVWVNEQTPLNAKNLNHMEEGIFNASEGVDQVAAVRSIGRDTIVQKTVNIPEDVDDEGHQIDRTNVAEGAFSAVFGSRNITGEKASESIVVGGLNKDYGQDNGIFGYRCEAYANQGFTGGYRVKNYGSESLAIGSNSEIQGTITLDAKGNPKSNTKSVLAVGTKVYVGSGSENSVVVGKNIAKLKDGDDYYGPESLKASAIFADTTTIKDGCSWIGVEGYGHEVGESNECVYIRGYQNRTADHVTDSVLFGYLNSVQNNGNKQTGKEQFVYLFGTENTNRWDNNSNTNSRVCLIGEGLKSTRDGQVIIGKYNSGVPNAIFEIGDGGADNDRQSPFAVINGYSLISGSTTVSDYAETSCVIGWANNVYAKTYGAGVFGNYNTLGVENTTSEVDYPFIAGDNNTVTHNHSSAIGHYLVSTAADQMTVGKYNSTSSTYNSASFQVGTGSSSSRKTSFAVFSDKVMFPTISTVGNYGATTQYVSTYVTSVVGDINSALDAINGTVV